MAEKVRMQQGGLKGCGQDGAGKRRIGTGVKVMAAAALISLSMAATALAEGPGWVNKEDGWYYYQEDGSVKPGWVKVDKVDYFLLDTGRCLTDAVTPDGYYVNGSGAWFRRGTEVLGYQMSAPDKFASVDVEWKKSESLAALEKTIRQVFGGARLLKVTDSAIEYVSIESTEEKTSTGTGTGSWTSPGSSSQTSSVKAEKETLLLGLYREPRQGQFRLDIRIKLDQGSTDRQRAATFDYGIFQAMVYQISSSPEILEEALYSAWEGENPWNINRQGWVFTGDCQTTYKAGNGFGRFYMKARESAPVQETAPDPAVQTGQAAQPN